MIMQAQINDTRVCQLCSIFNTMPTAVFSLHSSFPKCNVHSCKVPINFVSCWNVKSMCW